MLLAVRRALFAVGFYIGVVLMGILTTLVARWFNYRIRSKYLLCWNRWTLFWARVTLGVRWRVEGLESLPDEPVVFLSNHETEGETYFLQLLLRPVSTVLKKELLNIPFFGLGLKLMLPIAIDRRSPKESMRQLLQIGQERLNSGLNVLVFPQGSRVAPTSPLKYARGGAAIACNSGAPVVPIVHNASIAWAGKGIKLKPGEITVIIGAPIDTEGKTAKQLTDEVAAWTIEQRAALPY